MDHKEEMIKESLLERAKRQYLGKEVKDSRSEAGNWLGLTLEHIERGTATISLIVKKEMTNPYGNIHGGMMSLVMDETVGWAVISLDAEHHYTSLSLNIDFLYAIKEGERLKAKAIVVREGKKILNVECAIYNMQGTLLAKGATNLIVTSMKIKDNN